MSALLLLISGYPLHEEKWEGKWGKNPIFVSTEELKFSHHCLFSLLVFIKVFMFVFILYVGLVYVGQKGVLEGS